MKFPFLIFALLISTAAGAQGPTLPQTNDPRELKQIIAQQNQEIQQLRSQLANIEPAAGNTPNRGAKIIDLTKTAPAEAQLNKSRFRTPGE